MGVGSRRNDSGSDRGLTEAEFVSGPEPLRFRGYTLPSPLYYVAESATGRVTNPSTLLASKPVAEEPPDEPPELPYSPRYDQMEPAQRATYLAWLATGRASGEVPVGYAFTLYYGLERRLFESEERGAIRRELRHLLELFGDDRSFRRHASDLLGFDTARNLGPGGWDATWDEIPLEAAGAPTSRRALSIRLAMVAREGQPIPAHLAFAVAERDDRSTDSVVLDRTRSAARKLFEKRYRGVYGRGLEVEPGPSRIFRYKEGKSALRRELRLAGVEASLQTEHPDPLADREQFTGIVELLETCIEDLRPYNRVVREEAEEERTVAKWESLPDDLKAEFPNPREEEWVRVVEEHPGGDGVVWVPARILAELCGESTEGRLERSQCRTIAERAALMGFAVEPDPEVVPHSWGAGETVGLVRTRWSGREPTAAFRVASLATYLVSYVASSVGDVGVSRGELVEGIVGIGLELDRLERRRLEVLADVLPQADQNMRGVGDRVGRLFDDTQRQAVGELLTRVAGTGGMTGTRERQYLRRAYRALGFGTSNGRTAPPQVGASAEPASPVTVRDGESVAGEPVPEQREVTDGEELTELDRERIDEVRRETRQVADLLGEELSDGAVGSTAGAGATAGEADDFDDVGDDGGDAGEDGCTAAGNRASVRESSGELAERYRGFVEAVVERNRWTDEDLRELARQHGLMAAACVSAVNEWADEQLGGFLIRGGETYEIRHELLEEE